MNKKVLVFTGMRDFAALEEAVVMKEEYGYDVYFVSCDKNIGGCYHNPLCSTLQCRFCHYTMKKKIKELTKKSDKYHYVSVSDLIKNNPDKEINNYEFEYNDVKSLKDITYKGVDVGYGAFSSFVTFTRNVMPTFNSNLKEYLNFFYCCPINDKTTLIPSVLWHCIGIPSVKIFKVTVGTRFRAAGRKVFC